MNYLNNKKKHISFILCMTLILSLWGFVPGEIYGESETEVVTPAEKEAASLEKKITEPEPKADFKGYIVRIKDSMVNMVSNNDEAEDVSSSESERYYLVNTTLEALEFASASSIKYIEPNYRVYPTSDSPNDPDYTGLGSYTQKNMYEAMGIEKLWENGLDGEGVTVAVLDSGINAHQDMVSEDFDVYHSGFTEDEESIYENFTKSAIGNDINGHGTQVTSLIKAGKNNDKNIAGIAPESDIIFIKVFQENDQGQTEGYSAQIVWGLEYLLENDIPDVINMSVATSDSESFEDTCTDLANAGCIVVASSGNYGNKTDPYVSPNMNDIVYPAGLSGVIGVGAVDSSLAITAFSTKNSSVDVSAWGNIVPVLSATNSTSTRTNNGTSFSSPIVAGIAACLKQANPDINHDSFLEALENTSTKKGDVSVGNRNDSYGYGVVSAGGLLIELAPSAITSYAINFDLGAGSWVGENTLNSYRTYETPIPLPTNVALSGNIFKGWYDNANYSGNPITEIPQGASEDLTYYAKWYDKVTVTFDAGEDMTQPDPVELTIGNAYGSLPSLTKAGYTLEGWYLDSSLSNKIDPTTTVSAFNHTLYAKWSPNPYTISLDVNGGNSLTTSSLTYYHDTNLTNLPQPTRTGYSFAGWFTQREGGEQVGSSTVVKDNMTIFARWNANSHTITLNPYGGDSLNPSSLTYYYDSYLINLPQATRTGYNFDGWYTEPTYGALVGPLVKVTGDMSLFARWSPNSHTINLDVNGGDLLSQSSIQYNYDSTLNGLPSPSRTGYTFLGWFTGKDSGELVGSSTVVKGDMNLYARWSPNSQTITLNTNGGDILSPSSLTYYYDSKLTGLPTPTKTSYKFEGWYTATNQGILVNSETVVKGNMTLYAIWGTKIEVSFDPGYGVTKPAPKYVNVGDPIGTLPAITKVGYTFSGWYLDSSFTEEVSPQTTTGATDIVLYAKWTPNPYTIILNSNGGNPVSTPVLTYNYDSNLTGLPTPLKTGYTFLGWYTDPNYGTLVSASTTVKGNMTLYAHWSANEYTITLNVNKGKKIGTRSKKVVYDKQIGSLPTPKRTGYNFLGWKTKKSGGTTYLATTQYKKIGNITLYANWTKKKVVKFNANKGTVTTYSKAIKKGKKYGSLPKPTRAGYKFKGWYTKKSGGKKITSKTKVKTKKNHTVYAQWKKQ